MARRRAPASTDTTPEALEAAAATLATLIKDAADRGDVVQAARLRTALAAVQAVMAFNPRQAASAPSP